MNTKFYLFIFIIYVIISVFISYNFIYSTKLKDIDQEYKDVLLRVSETSSLAIDGDDLERVIQSNGDFSDPSIMQDYKNILRILREIKDIHQGFVTYIYIYIPLDENNVSILIDADSDISEYNISYNIEEFPKMFEALTSDNPIIEQNMSYDKAYDIYSISAYIPVYNDNNQRIATLGVDSSLQNYDQLTKMRASGIFALALCISIMSIVIPIFIFLLYEELKNNQYSRKINTIIRRRRGSMKKHLEK